MTSLTPEELHTHCQKRKLDHQNLQNQQDHQDLQDHYSLQDHQNFKNTQDLHEPSGPSKSSESAGPSKPMEDRHNYLKLQCCPKQRYCQHLQDCRNSQALQNLPLDHQKCLNLKDPQKNQVGLSELLEPCHHHWGWGFIHRLDSLDSQPISRELRSPSAGKLPHMIADGSHDLWRIT